MSLHFCIGDSFSRPFFTMSLTDSIIVNIIVTLFLTIISGCILNGVSEKMISILDGRKVMKS